MGERLLRALHDRSGEPASLDAWLDRGGEAWNRLRDLARSRPSLLDGEAIDTLDRRCGEAPHSFFALLLDVAARDEDRREAAVARFRRLMPAHRQAAMSVAGFNLHEYQHLLDRDWVALALSDLDSGNEGGWGIVTASAMYRPDLLGADELARLHACHGRDPEAYARSLLAIAAARESARAELLERVVGLFARHPAAAVGAAARSARSEPALLVPDLLAAVLSHLAAAPEAGWEFFAGAARARPEAFDDALLDALEAQASGDGAGAFAVLRALIGESGPPAPALLGRFATLIHRFPAAGIDAAKYAFQGERARALTPGLISAVCDGFAAAAYPAYELLGRCLTQRPELIGVTEVEAALRAIGHATNYAFGFFKRLLAERPEFTRECTLALFECLAQEPPHRAFMRAEEMDAIVAISDAAHVRTGLENALREPPGVGSRRARALMAIMFRQKLRARRQVLLEALRYAAGVTRWRKPPPELAAAPGEDGEKVSPVWDFLLFIIDQADDSAVSTAAAERFLEGMLQLHYLCANLYEHDELVAKLDLGWPPERPFPEGFRFLAAEADLANLYHLMLALRERFASEPRQGPLEEFARRRRQAESELNALREKLSRESGERRRRLEERAFALEQRCAWWSDPGYARAFDDPAAEAALDAEARTFLKRERKDLAKRMRDALRAEAVGIAVSAVERLRMTLYRQRVNDVLGREVELGEVDQTILPAFLWFQAVTGMPANERWLRRLIEDRILKRQHDWLRDEAAPRAWSERVRQACPGIDLARWRAPYTREIRYRAGDAAAERKRRIVADLSQARALLERAGALDIAGDTHAELADALARLRAAAPSDQGEPPQPPPDAALLEEASMNLERVRLAEQTPDSDFEGIISLSVESDPFAILFMGEYGFASCLSLRGINAWSAVSNAIDVDKTVVWARDGAGNVVGRRLIALMPEGVLSFRTYTNRHALALDGAFRDFIADYAKHCGTSVIRRGHPQALLSDRWYDDGAI
jgi:hypothetical protein